MEKLLNYLRSFYLLLLRFKTKIQTSLFPNFYQYRKRERTPTVLQMEAVECGAAALGIILGYYGRIVPLAELRKECGVSRDGAKASNILKAAKNYGLTGKGFKKELEAIKEIRCPYIVFWNFNHFLVVEGFSKKRVYLNDPATGPRPVTWEEFDESYTGVILVMEPGVDFVKGGRKPNIIFALWERLRDSLGAIAYCLLAGLLLVIPGLAIPAFTQIFVDQILIQNRQEWLNPLLLGLSATALIRGLLATLRFKYLRYLKIKLAVTMSSEFIWHILRLPISFYAQRFAGEIANRVRINDQVADILSGQLATTIIDMIMMIFYGIVMSEYDLILTMIGIFFASINLVALMQLSRWRVDANLRLGQEESKASGFAIAGLQSIETIKASALESDFFSRWSGYYAKTINAQQELDLQNQALGTLPIFLNAITSILILVIGGLRVIEGNLSIGMLIAFQSLMESFLEPINRFVNLGSKIQELEGDLSRLDDVLNNPIDPQMKLIENQTQLSGAARSTTTLMDDYRLQGYVELRNICFGYSPVDAPLIENFNLQIYPGQRVALVGASGSGKSTVAKLISGLYNPWEGEILFDGILREEIPRAVLINSIAMVDQEILLFAGTIRENLTLWDNSIPDRYLIQACQDAAIADVVISLEGGYNAYLLESAGNLSGGQQQRLEIARALVNNPRILIMDEATSALDPETEKIIDQNLRRRGCTCIIVAHRLTTIRDCDLIMVFEKGKVVQQGTHEELWQEQGIYAELISSE